MKKQIYIQPDTEIVQLKGDPLMEGEWWSVAVDPSEEIEDDDIGAKQGFLESGELPHYSPWED